MPTIHIIVRGCAPKPWGTDEWEWRRTVAHSARLITGSEKEPPPSQGTLFGVEIIFRMPGQSFSSSDLDNLAKPVLDTLFLPNHPQVKDMNLTGALFEIDDSKVARLLIEKKQVDHNEDQGADITVEW